MRTDYDHYTVDIKNLKFTSDNHIVHPKTAIITFFDNKKTKLAVEILGYQENEEIYKWIDEGKPVILDQCYVHNFSLTEYRSTRGLEKKSTVIIRSFQSSSAFYESKFGTDFSFARFEEGGVVFDETHFAYGPVSFNSVFFGDGDVRFDHVYFREGVVDFGNVSFGAGIKKFNNSVFGAGKKDFQYCSFGPGEVSFANCEFDRGELSFINADFGEGNVSFKIMRVKSGKVDFHYAKFGKGDISFERADFGDCRVDFRAVEFNKGRINFNRSVFGQGEITFEGSEMLSGRFSFKRAALGKGSVSFELAEFENAELFFEKSDMGEGDISFLGGRFGLLSLQSCHLDHYLDLRVAHCGYLDLSDTIARDIIDFQPYDQEVMIDVMNLAGMRLLGRIYIDWQDNEVQKMICKQESSNRLKAEQFRILKENFSVTGQYVDEDKAYVQFKRFEAIADLEVQKKKSKWYWLWAWPQFGFKWLVFDKIGLYATDPVRVLISMVFSFLIFTLIYIFLPFIFDTHIVSSLGDPDKLSSVAVAFYHSAITFLTIGYGDYYPSGIIRWISGFEGFVGLFMMSYFTVAFVRKILR
ncbi:MAG: two pore domain potassium channel family protein [Chlorobi bacterium]|nr:two pore domain potassium channel family protein [Chlorobiota bacterium]